MKKTIFAILYYSNLTGIWRKFVPEKSKRGGVNKVYPTGILWFLGGWSAVYGLMYQFHDSSRSKIENRASIIISSQQINKAAETQNWEQNLEPKWWFPFSSLWREKNEGVIVELKEFIRNRRTELSNANLRNAKLDSIDLSSAKMDMAKLDGADFTDSKLEGISYTYGDLRYAKITGTSFKGSDLSCTKIPWNTIDLSEIQGSNLKYDTIKNVRFGRIELQGTRFINCVFDGDRFDSTGLTVTWFHSCVFRNCVFNKADLNLSDMAGATFEKSSLDSTDFSTVYRDSLDSRIPGYKRGQESRLIRD